MAVSEPRSVCLTLRPMLTGPGLTLFTPINDPRMALCFAITHKYRASGQPSDAEIDMSSAPPMNAVGLAGDP